MERIADTDGAERTFPSCAFRIAATSSMGFARFALATMAPMDSFSSALSSRCASTQLLHHQGLRSYEKRGGIPRLVLRTGRRPSCFHMHH